MDREQLITETNAHIQFVHTKLDLHKGQMLEAYYKSQLEYFTAILNLLTSPK